MCFICHASCMWPGALVAAQRSQPHARTDMAHNVCSRMALRRIPFRKTYRMLQQVGRRSHYSETWPRADARRETRDGCQWSISDRAAHVHSCHDASDVHVATVPRTGLCRIPSNHNHSPTQTCFPNDPVLTSALGFGGRFSISGYST